MNSKHAFLALSVFTLVSIAHGEREVFAPTKLAPVAEAGIIRFGDGTVAAPSMTFKSDTDTGVFKATDNTLGITTGGTERMRITAAGDVGIGPTPANRLNLTYNGASGVATVGPNSTSGNTALTLGTSSAGTYAERMRIDSAGNVGIGAAPTVKLDVNDNTQATTIRVNGSAAGGSNIRLQTDGTERLTLSSGTANGFITNNNGGLIFAASNSLAFETGNPSVRRMDITNTGDITIPGSASATPGAGIIRGQNASGTDVAAANLTIQAGRGTGTGAGGALVFQTSAAGTTGSTLNAATERMRIQPDGIVNIGGGVSLANATSFAGKQAVIAGGDADGGALSFYANASFLGNTGRIAAIPTAFGSNSSSALTFSTNSGSQLNERMRIDSSGNVGIGTNTNLSTLTINGPIAPKGPTDVNAATYTVATTDSSLRFTTTNCTVTLPAAASFPGRILWLNTVTANSVTSNASNVIPLGSNTAGTAIFAATAGKFAMIQSNGTNWVTMMSN